MFKALRTRIHITPSTIIATLALLFAMSGGAYAASKYLITSTKQISPKVLKSLKGANGKNGANGTNGANGAAGTGSAGPTGPGGVTGPAGGAGPTGPAGESVKVKALTAPECTNKEGGSEFTVGTTKTQACNGEKGAIHPKETLPKGATETGTWNITATAEEAKAGIVASTSISFPIPLEGGLSNSGCKTSTEPCHAFLIPPGEEGTVDPTQCPGSVGNPEAAEGDLCVYTTELGNATVPTPSFQVPSIPLSSHTAGTGAAGGILYLLPEETEPAGLSYGTWAVTAP
jgi:hypothetical protein